LPFSVQADEMPALLCVLLEQAGRNALCAKLSTPMRQPSAVQRSSVIRHIMWPVSAAFSLMMKHWMNRRLCVRCISVLPVRPLAKPSLPVCAISIYSCGLLVSSMLWRCWLGGRKDIRPVKSEWWSAGVVVCLEWGADLHMAQSMPLPLTVSCFSKIQIGFALLVPAHPGSPGKTAVKRVFVLWLVTDSISEKGNKINSSCSSIFSTLTFVVRKMTVKKMWW